MNIYFTSDNHFGHVNILKYSHRPFSDVHEMNEVMMERWNEVVRPQDIVYHIGDFTLNSYKFADEIFKRLNGQVLFVEGSHDRWLKDFNYGYPIRTAQGLPVHILPPLCTIEHRKTIIILCHYSLRSWDRSHYGTWHLFGHHHNTLPPYGLSFDIGVDGHNFYPWEFSEVLEKMNTLEPIVDYSKGRDVDQKENQ